MAVNPVANLPAVPLPRWSILAGNPSVTTPAWLAIERKNPLPRFNPFTEIPVGPPASTNMFPIKPLPGTGGSGTDTTEAYAIS